jgi:hypothetical protein
MGKQSVSVGSLMRVTGYLENCPELALGVADIVESTRNSASIKRRYVDRPPNCITKLEPVMCVEKSLQF